MYSILSSKGEKPGKWVPFYEARPLGATAPNRHFESASCRRYLVKLLMILKSAHEMFA